MRNKESFRVEVYPSGEINVVTKTLSLSRYVINRGKVTALIYDIMPKLNNLLNLVYGGEVDVSPNVIDDIMDAKFIIILRYDDGIILLRDPIGYIPCYLHYNNNFSYVISDRMFLDEKFTGSIRLYPWHIYEFKVGKALLVKGSYHFLLNYGKHVEKALEQERAADFLKKYLQIRLNNLVNKLKLKQRQIYISYSGGVDSSLTARLLEEAGCKVTAIISGLSNSREFKDAQRNAKLLGLDYQLMEIKPSLSEIEDDIIKLIKIIEDFTPMNVAIGLAQYWIIKGVGKGKILAVGQGADEVYAGYQRYVNIYKERGKSAALEDIKYHVIYSYKINFEREWKLSVANNIQMLYPLISPGIIYFISGLPIDYLISDPGDLYRKRILRIVAKKLRIPKEIYMRPKKSMQYATGSMNIIRKISKRYNLKPFQYLYEKFIDIFVKDRLKL